jgi:hypothetical protein
MKNTLFTIETKYLELMNQIQEMDGEITPEMEEQLQINETQLQSKSIAYLEVIKKLEGRKITIKDQIKYLQALEKREQKIIDNLKERLLEAVKMFGDFEVGLQKFGTRKSTKVTVDIETNKLPTEFKTVKVTESPNKTAIKDAIKRGEDVTGCELTEVLNLKIN